MADALDDTQRLGPKQHIRQGKAKTIHKLYAPSLPDSNILALKDNIERPTCVTIVRDVIGLWTNSRGGWRRTTSPACRSPWGHSIPKGNPQGRCNGYASTRVHRLRCCSLNALSRLLRLSLTHEVSESTALQETETIQLLT
jgi:hypothetical protein